MNNRALCCWQLAVGTTSFSGNHRRYLVKGRQEKLGFVKLERNHQIMTFRWQLASIFFAAACYFGVVVSDQIIPAHSGSSFVRSSREPKFKVEFHSDDSTFHPDDDQESIIMSNKNGEKFLCFLPKLEKSKTGKLVSQQNISSVVVESETRIKLKTPDELLDVLKDLCFLRQEGWWTYEFCYQNQLKQFHLEDGKVVQEFVLGIYDAEATEAFNKNLSDVSTLKDPRSKDASQRYHLHIFRNGTLCDLTNEPREAEVRFVCAEPRAMISSFTELSTCKYAITFQCPTLCKHPSFQEERPVSHTIHCNAVPKAETQVRVKREADSDKSEDGKITMVTDIVYLPASSSEQQAT